MIETDFPILSGLVAWPLLAALSVAVCRHAQLAKMLALTAASIELLLSIAAVQQFNPANEAFQLVESYLWIPTLNIRFLLGIDGIAVLLLPATALLMLMAIGTAWRTQTLTRLHWVLLLLLESCMMGVFSALDMVLFFFFWQLTLPPLFFLLGLWGIGPMRRSAATKHTFFMLFSSMPLLLAIALLAINHASGAGGVDSRHLSFNLPVLLETPLPEPLQPAVFFLLLLAFAVKVPLVPFHTWLPTVALEGPAHVTALLTGLTLGIFGVIRFALPLAPSAAVEYSWLLGLLGAISLAYAALIALHQTNLRVLLAYACISQAGLILIGIASLNMQGIQGALLQMVNFPLVAGSLMMIAGFLHQRIASTELAHIGGLAKLMPQLTRCYLLLAFASLGMPGAGGFPAGLLLLIGSLMAHPSLGIMSLVGVVLSAAYLLTFTRRFFFGPVNKTLSKHIQDLLVREKYILCIPLLLLLWLGFFPNSVLKVNQKTAEVWLTRLLMQPKLEGEVADSRQTGQWP